MEKEFQKILEEARKTKLKDEEKLTGGNKYINPIRKQYMGKKKKKNTPDEDITSTNS